MTPFGKVHFVFSLVAIVAGGIVMFLPKGTRWHRTVGHAYAMAMVGVVVTSFLLFGLTGSFGPFHFAAIVGGVTLVAGLWTVLARRPKGKWIQAHATWMAWSYIGLLAAAAAETLTRFVMPSAAGFLEGNQLWGTFWGAVGFASFAVVGVGMWLVKTRLPQVIDRTPQAMRAERQRLAALEAGNGGRPATS